MDNSEQIVVVQSEWDEEDDEELHTFLKERHPDYKMCNEEDILKMNPKNVLALFCDTVIFQEFLNRNGVQYEVRTYPEELKEFYKRDIRTIRAGDVSDVKITGPYNYFVKPTKNDKSFNGTLICSPFERDYILEKILDKYGSLDVDIYICREVVFVNEFRVFVLNNEIHGVVESTDNLIDKTRQKSAQPPKTFLDQVVKASPYPNCAIDVAMKDNGEWCVVEVNPPYALMSYGLPINDYFKFCQKSFEDLINKKNMM